MPDRLSRRDFLKIAAGLGAAAGAAVSPQTRQAADALDSAAQAAAAEGAKKATDAWKDQWEGQPALRLTPIGRPDATNIWHWWEEAAKGDLQYRPELFSLRRAYVGSDISYELKNQYHDSDPTIYLNEAFGAKPFIVLEDPTLPKDDPNRLYPHRFTGIELGITPQQFRTIGNLVISEANTDIHPNSDQARKGVDIWLFTRRNSDHLLTTVLVSYPTIIKAGDSFYELEETSTGIKDAMHNAGKPVEPIK